MKLEISNKYYYPKENTKKKKKTDNIFDFGIPYILIYKKLN